MKDEKKGGIEDSWGGHRLTNLERCVLQSESQALAARGRDF